MDKFNLLDCTLRDGGYITDWKFDNQLIKATVANLIDANVDFIECGYLNNQEHLQNSTMFNDIKQLNEFIPKNKKNSFLLAMANVSDFNPKNLSPNNGNSIDGIRVAFHKHQVKEALELCESVKKNNYKLIVQPMVTSNYSINEYMAVAKQIAELKPYAVAIVDSFGYMLKQEFTKYFRVLDNVLDSDALIGFHLHNNMQSAFVIAQDILDYVTTRKLIIDASLYGMGRGAGNLNIELIANYYNLVEGEKYNINSLLELISDYIMPIAAHKKWGYSPHFYLTSLYRCHPNFATYLLEKHDLSVSEFNNYLKLIPDELKTKGRRTYVEEIYQKYMERFEKKLRAQ
jgi:4-hydroxy 2-oxovalerate aldolase